MLVVVSHDGKAMAKAVELAHTANIPVLAYDRLILDSDLDLYMSFDNLNVGRLQAKFVLDQLNGRKANIVRIHGAPTDNNAKLFKQGADEVLKPAARFQADHRHPRRLGRGLAARKRQANQAIRN